MPTSHPEQIEDVLSVIIYSMARSFLEIGPGFGKWGVLTREYVDISDGREKYDRADWGCRIDCIEAFAPYVTPLHRYVYNDVRVGDAKHLISSLEHRYDLTLMIDVLEHFSREDGMRLLSELLTSRSRGVLISAPKDIGEQGAAFANVYETHRYQWRRSDLSDFGPYFVVPNPRSLIVYIGPDANRIRARLMLAKWPRLRRLVQRVRRSA
jgi:hypothetical protein